jgi:para-aminobenzoate synthetase component 1
MTEMTRLPLVVELKPAPSAEGAFVCLAALPGCIFLDSSLVHDPLGRFSFLAADPFDQISLPAGRAGLLDELRRRLAPLATPPCPGLPPFQGGAAGLFGYELNHSLETLPWARWDEFHLPALSIGLYDLVVAFDHQTSQVWVISHGLPELDPPRRRKKAEERLEEFVQRLSGPSLTGHRGRTPETPAALAAPHHRVDGNMYSNFSRREYLRAVQQVIDYIRQGDIFQANLSQRLVCRANCDPVTLYLRIRRQTPAPFAGYYDAGSFQVISASPERFLMVRDGQVETRPIKGTRPDWQPPEVRMFAAEELRSSEKDRAENIMIVDLMRNDLSRVCLPESISVPQLCAVEAYGYVQHLVSVVRGVLRADSDALGLIAAAFPGGSVTGAPKVRAMEIITELEQVARGAYCGSLGYVAWDGRADLNILIRTLTASRGWWQFPVGGGIVAQSDPRREYEETWTKARWILPVLEP